MQISDYVLPKQRISHPKCPECGAEMLLARIESDEPDHDSRTLECQVCLKEVIKIVKYR